MFVHFKGGIDGDHIKLALEPEAASIWCQQVNVGKGLEFSRTGSKYMVVDLGGKFYFIKVNSITKFTTSISTLLLLHSCIKTKQITSSFSNNRWHSGCFCARKTT